jgi:hypothetical protein
MAGYHGQALRSRATLCRTKAMPMAAEMPRSSMVSFGAAPMSITSTSSSSYAKKESFAMKPQAQPQMKAYAANSFSQLSTQP